MKSFREDNENFKKEFAMQNQIIGRYDEILSHKASIHSMFEERKYLEDKFTSPIEKLQSFDVNI